MHQKDCHAGGPGEAGWAVWIRSPQGPLVRNGNIRIYWGRGATGPRQGAQLPKGLYLPGPGAFLVPEAGGRVGGGSASQGWWEI